MKSDNKNVVLINNKIRAPKVRLIDENGNLKGVIPTKEALEIALGVNLDLVVISAGDEFPVCKIMDYGKYKYQQQKKQQEAKKKQKVIVIKEVQLSLHIAEHDYNVKLNAAKKFIDSKHKVKVSLRLKGRQMILKEEAIALMQRFFDAIGTNIAKLEQPPKLEGYRVNMVIAPI